MSASWMLNQYSRRLCGKIPKSGPAHHGTRTRDLWCERPTLYLCTTVFFLVIPKTQISNIHMQIYWHFWTKSTTLRLQFLYAFCLPVLAMCTHWRTCVCPGTLTWLGTWRPGRYSTQMRDWGQRWYKPFPTYNKPTADDIESMLAKTKKNSLNEGIITAQFWKHRGKRRNCSFWAISPFATMF